MTQVGSLTLRNDKIAHHQDHSVTTVYVVSTVRVLAINGETKTNQ
jgi:hypothetical protein